MESHVKKRKSNERIDQFLNQAKNSWMRDEIQTVCERAKILFPGRIIMMDLLPEPETGEDVLHLMIEAKGGNELKKEEALLYQLYEYIELQEHFIVNLHFGNFQE